MVINFCYLKLRTPRQPKGLPEASWLAQPVNWQYVYGMPPRSPLKMISASASHGEDDSERGTTSTWWKGFYFLAYISMPPLAMKFLTITSLGLIGLDLYAYVIN